jgi:hypothetical protein
MAFHNILEDPIMRKLTGTATGGGGGNGTGGKQQEEARVDEYIVVMMKNTSDACQVKALHCRHWCTTKTKIKSRKYTCRHWIR